MIKFEQLTAIAVIPKKRSDQLNQVVSRNNLFIKQDQTPQKIVIDFDIEAFTNL